MARRFLPLTLIAPGLLLGGCAGMPKMLGELQSSLFGDPSPPAAKASLAGGTVTPGPQMASTLAMTVAAPLPARPQPHYVVGKPYQFDGTWYRPAVDYGYDEAGMAELYPAEAAGQPTTDGEVYDPKALTAAHKTLPLPSIVRVTNEENGRSVELRVNDRGPFDDRLIRLSQAAAESLGVGADQPARVRVEIMAEESRALAAALGAGGPESEEHLPASPAPRLTTEPLPALQPVPSPPPGTNTAELSLPVAPAVQASAAPPHAVVPGPQFASAGPDALASAPPAGLHYVIGKPYQFDGVWYRPAADEAYDRTGLATVYPKGADGEPTTDGEAYDETALTAAHKTLPLPSVVRVTNLDSGRSVELRVNDRGPFQDDKLIQLSGHAAEMLGIAPGVTAEVRVQIMAQESRRLAESLGADRGAPGAQPMAAPEGTNLAALPPVPAADPAAADALPPHHVVPGPMLASLADVPVPERAPVPYNFFGGDLALPAPAAALDPMVTDAADRQAFLRASAESAQPVAVPAPQPSAAAASALTPAASGGEIFVQAGAFLDPDNASRLRSQLAALGKATVVPVELQGRLFNCVRIGPLSSRLEAQQMLKRVVALGYGDALVIGE